MTRNAGVLFDGEDHFGRNGPAPKPLRNVALCLAYALGEFGLATCRANCGFKRFDAHNGIL